MFNDQYGLTKAVLEGRKTQTRRVINDGLQYIMEGSDAILKQALFEKSRYKRGEIVAVAQSYQDAQWQGKMSLGPGRTNKMFVRADLMPHRIRITNVRIERLKGITNEDCMKEGIIHHHAYGDRDHEDYGFDDSFWFTTPRKAFAALIDKTCGRGTWDSNPWVFIYDFELIK